MGVKQVNKGVPVYNIWPGDHIRVTEGEKALKVVDTDVDTSSSYEIVVLIFEDDTVRRYSSSDKVFVTKAERKERSAVSGLPKKKIKKK